MNKWNSTISQPSAFRELQAVDMRMGNQGWAQWTPWVQGDQGRTEQWRREKSGQSVLPTESTRIPWSLTISRLPLQLAASHLLATVTATTTSHLPLISLLSLCSIFCSISARLFSVSPYIMCLFYWRSFAPSIPPPKIFSFQYVDLLISWSVRWSMSFKNTTPT